MAGIYDTHTHINDPMYIEMDTATSEIIDDANKAGVNIINVVGYDVKSSKVAVRQANQYPNVYAVVGIHPNNAHLFTDDAYDSIDDVANGDNVVAIGETGLDYSFTTKHEKAQKDAFERQIKIAKKHNLPIVLHIVDKEGSTQAYLDAIEILKKNKVENAVVHSFEGPVGIAQELLKMGYYLSFSGEITFNTELKTVVDITSLNKMMIETDSPFSTPVPFKGQTNYPKNAGLVAQKIADIKNTDVDEVISATRINGQNFFGLSK